MSARVSPSLVKSVAEITVTSASVSILKLSLLCKVVISIFPDIDCDAPSSVLLIAPKYEAPRSSSCHLVFLISLLFTHWAVPKMIFKSAWKAFVVPCWAESSFPLVSASTKKLQGFNLGWYFPCRGWC